jgi:hypothetical protein
MDKNFVIGTAMVVVMAAAIMSTTQVATAPADGSLSALYHTAVCVYKNGVLQGPCEHNNVTNIGLNWTRDALGFSGIAGKAAYIALGNTTSADTVTLTTLGGQYPDCGLTINGATTGPTAAVVGTSNGNWSVSALWTSTCNGIVVNNTALYNNSTAASCSTGGCVMFAGKSFTPVTLQANDQLNITWYVWVTNVAA